MSTEIQTKPSTALEAQKKITPMELIREAMQGARTPEEKQAAIGIVKELVALQQSMQRSDWEAEERQDEIDFGNALNKCQSQIGRIAPNKERENRILWADYAQIDRIIRPIYIEAGFSIGFSEVKGDDPQRIYLCATLTRGRKNREYFADISRKAPNSSMGAADADAAAKSRLKRYLMLQIFNIAIGIDHDEKAPFTNGEAADWIAAIEAASTPMEVMTEWTKAQEVARKQDDYKTLVMFTEARDNRLKQLKKEAK